MFFDVPPVMAMPSARNPSDRMEEVRKNGAPPLCQPELSPR